MSQGITRRGFLKRGMEMGAAGMTAPYVLRSGVLAHNGNPGANDRIVIGHIGVGAMGAGMTRIFTGFDDVEIAAVADVDLANANQVGNDLGVDIYQDYRELLDRDDIDAVVIATPEHWHGLIAIHAAQAGKDIYCEKPISLTIGEGRKMVEAVRKYGRVFQTGSQDRSNPQNYRACMLIRNGLLGKIERVIAHNHASPALNGLPGHPVPDDLDWDMWCGPVQPHPYHPHFRTVRGWVAYRDFAGHSMTSNGTHGMDQIQWALGMDGSGPVEIWTEGEPFQPPLIRGDGRDVPGNHFEPKVYMRYANDIIMELGDAPLWGGHFFGENGSILIDRGQFTADPPELADVELEDLEVQLYKSDHHWRNWVDCIKTREDPIAAVEMGHGTATVCHLANIARWVSQITGETGERLKWDPETERFANSTWGNHFLDRPRRAPYDYPNPI